MNKETSTYLDCVRFLAAFTVLLCHLDEYLVKGIMPFADHLGIEAVGVFFVLSGFVIGYATHTQEKDLKTYTINRAARLYSVVIPCLAITLLLDFSGRYFAPAAYSGFGTMAGELRHTIFSLTFLNYTWLMPHKFTPGSDGPFWSLCFEVPYYFIFGTALFLRGFWRWLVPVFACLCAGLWIVGLFPIWLGGLLTYRICRNADISVSLGRGILLFSVLLWVTFEAVLWRLDICSSVAADIRAGPILLYGAGIPFAFSILGFRFSAIRVSQYARPITWLSGATFTLYLLHFPLVWFLHSVLPASWPALIRWMILVSSALSLTFIVAHFTERRKNVWRRYIEKFFDAAGRVFLILNSKLRPGNSKIVTASPFRVKNLPAPIISDSEHTPR